MYAHVAGIPVEETALALAPVAAVSLAVVAARARGARARMRARLAQLRGPGMLRKLKG